jgi:hypothetical protein
MIYFNEKERRTLDDYCVRAKAAVDGTGADANEVIDDLRRHVEEEVRAARLAVVTEEDVRRILARVGEPGVSMVREKAAPPPAPSAPTLPEVKPPGVILFLLGVVLPLGTLIFELVTGISAGVLFDPMPTWFHILAVAFVPATNLWIWRASRDRDARRAGLLSWLNGMALGICVYYCILYLAFVPIAALCVIYLGLGLIPLTPFFAFIATPALRSSYRRRLGRDCLPGGFKGALVSLGILLLLQVPTAATYYGLAKASAEDAATRLHGIRVLRTLGDNELMLRACYGMLRREMDYDVIRRAVTSDRAISAEQARETYFRVTGKPFNSVPPPSLYTRGGRWTMFEDDFAWDEALGGEEVAGRVKGLSLLSSRMDAVAEPTASLVYCEWTLEFKNVSTQPREARAQIALPPGAVVSRVTLWINGEEREAAFGGRGEVRAAYQQVAVVQRHDPVLVTTCGPDRVLLQCFPVPTNGGVMKVRLGITAPVALDAPDHGRFIWPRFLERNFRIAEDFQHALWMESPERLGSVKTAAASTRSNTLPFTMHESLGETNLTAAARSVEIFRRPEAGTVWTPMVADGGQVIRQTIRPATPALPSRIVLVVDGSEGMRPFVPEIAEALSKFPETTEVALVVASDEIRHPESQPGKATKDLIGVYQHSLRKIHFVGGQDNLPAIVAGWDLAAAVDDGVVVWIHLPQPVMLSTESALRQRLDRSRSPARLLELQVRNGPDRIVEKLDGLWAVEHVTHSSSVRADLEELVNEWTGKTRTFELVRENVAASMDTTNGPRVSGQLERLWARDETLRLAGKRQRDEATRLAAAHQLVTPVTGAVVLETKEQYDRFNLKPADPMTVPSIPEPQLPALIGVGVGVYVWLRRRRGR